MDEIQVFQQCVGQKGEEAKALIENLHPDLQVEIVDENGMCTMDFRLDRVRVFVNDAGIVVRPPKTG